MDRGRLVGLLILGVGLFALLARRAQAASAPAYVAAPEAAPAWLPSGGEAWAPLDWSGFPSYPSQEPAPSQPGPVWQAPGAVPTVDPWAGWGTIPEPGAGGAIDIWEGIPQEPAPAQVDPWGGIVDWGTGGAVDIWEGIPQAGAPAPTPAPAPSYTWEPGANVAAFLQLIRTTEGTENNGRGWSPYAVPYGYGFQITDYRAHPARLGWPGVPLGAQTCLNAGFPIGCVSTAAGAYQFNLPTWESPELPPQPDFSPASQDRKAIDLLRALGAYDAIVRGDLDTALRLASQRWASLPYATSGQPKVTVAQASAIYAQAGGATSSSGPYASSGTTTATIGIRG